MSYHPCDDCILGWGVCTPNYTFLNTIFESFQPVQDVFLHQSEPSNVRFLEREVSTPNLEVFIWWSFDTQLGILGAIDIKVRSKDTGDVAMFLDTLPKNPAAKSVFFLLERRERFFF